MFKITITTHFSSAHSLRSYKGKCENLHGHNWRVEVEVCSPELNEGGMVMDFSDLKNIVERVLAELDHRYLNDIDYFKTNNPSSEELARYIYRAVQAKISPARCHMGEVRVWETERACAHYKEERNV